MKTIQALAERVRRPVRVLQFGEGNFLRAFSDCMIDIANEKGIFDGSIAVVKPKPTGSLERFRRQDCMYTVVFRGRRNGETVDSARIVTSIDAVYHPLEDYDAWMALAALDTLQFIFSNTTEAGIVLDRNDHFDGLPESFPGKLTKFLYARYEAFRGSAAAGVTLLPAELIDRNGAVLRECVLTLSELWNLPEDFRDWLKNACTFCCTLVDRIVTGFPKDDPAALYEKLGYRDELADIAEPFGLWVIEGGEGLRERLPLQQAGLPVIFTVRTPPRCWRAICAASTSCATVCTTRTWVRSSAASLRRRSHPLCRCPWSRRWTSRPRSLNALKIPSSTTRCCPSR